MPRRRSPLFQRALNLFRISIFMAKIRNPKSSNLIFLKKTRKLKKLMLLKHYNYGFLEEYQFSPSNSPLFHRYRKPGKKISRRDIYSLLFFCRCSGSWRAEGGEYEGAEDVIGYALEAPPVNIDEAAIVEDFPYWDSKDDSVDQRAEIFIQKFYEQMKLQTQKSI